MLQGWFIVATSFAYIGLLFAVAWFADKRAAEGRSIISNAWVYSLSLAVYATAWTFYGSVGRAATDGVGFLPIYLGPTLTMLFGWFVLRKMVRIARLNRTTSLADFVASRYGKSALIGGLVTVIAVIGILPYISLQLKAVSTSFQILLGYPQIVMPPKAGTLVVMQDTAFYVAMFMALFAIAFGTRQLDAAERHEGMVAAVAFESLVKLVAFLAVGIYVAFFMYDGLGDIFARAAKRPDLDVLMAPLGGAAGSYASWVWLTVLSMLAIVFLPRQFQVAVIENTDERHLKRAAWLFPLYMLAINIFVLPIAFGGVLHFPQGDVDADTFVLTLPMVERAEGLALLVFIGGLSAATGMVIVETIALSTMVCNDLAMPLLLRIRAFRLTEQRDLSSLLLDIRRAAIVAILMGGYFYYLLAGEAYALVSIGLVSFAAVAQFAPAMIGGLYWKGGTRTGALAGLLAGFSVWMYTLLLPAFAKSGWLGVELLERGPWGIELLRPTQLFGLAGLDQITHAMIWSMIANVGAYVIGSVLRRQSAAEHAQATLFVDVFMQTGEPGSAWRGATSASALQTLVGRFLGPARAVELFTAYAHQRGVQSVEELEGDRDLVRFAELQLAGTIGAASARTMVATVAQEEPLGLEEVMSIIDEASQMIAYSHRLEEKQQELEDATLEPAGGQRAPEGTRPPQGRLHLHGHARAAHAAHLHPRLLRDPARQPGTRAGRAPALPRARDQGVGAPHAPHQPGARSRQDRVGARGVALGGDRRARGRAGGGECHERHLPVARRAGRGAVASRRAGGHGRPRPPDAGAAEPAFQCRQVLHAGIRSRRGPPHPRRIRPARGSRGQRGGHQRREPGDDLREVPAGGRHAHREARGHGAGARHLPAHHRPLRREPRRAQRARPRIGVLLRTARGVRRR